MSAGRESVLLASKWWLVLLPVSLVGLLTLGGLADEEPPAKSAPPTKRVEEEEESLPPSKPIRQVRRLDDEEKAPPKGKTSPPGMEEDIPDHEPFRQLLAAIANPADLIQTREMRGVKVDGKEILAETLRVELLPRYYSDIKNDEKSLEVQIVDAAGKRVRTQQLPTRFIDRLRYHEQAMLDRVRAFLSAGYDKRKATDPLFLSRAVQYQGANQALSRVLRQHESNVERGIRTGRGWENIRAELRRELLTVRLEQLRLLTAERSYEVAFQLASELIEEFTAGSEQQTLAQAVADLLGKAQADPEYPAEQLALAEQRLRLLEGRFTRSELYRPIAERLRARASDLLNRARQLVKEQKPDEAKTVLRQAEELYPELPELRTYRLEIDQSYQTLYVAMRELPRYLSPGWAVTDADRRCVELLFESLVELIPNEKGLWSYRPMLAEGRPKVMALGRQFQLPRQARWSDGKPITVGDIRTSIRWLQESGATGRSPAWGKLFPESGAVEALDRSRVIIRLQQGMLNPLEAMSFKLLPSRATPPANSEAFALNPVSSGPFLFAGTGKERNGQEFVRFQANPNYARRPSKHNLPRIKEIRILTPADPVKALLPLRDPKAVGSVVPVDLAMDLTAEQAAELEKAGCEIPLPRLKGSNRRIYFLAVNHRRAVLALPEARQALARAINREEILDEFFRNKDLDEFFRNKDLGRRVHQALNGPYPAGSWATNPMLVSRTDPSSLDPYDSDLARSKWKEALRKLNQKEVSLTLAYPNGDPQVKAAMEALCARLCKELPGLELKPTPLQPLELRQRVEQIHSYDLAYYHYDYPDESYWLYPLLGPVGPDGRENFLGYTGPLVNQMQRAESLRNFEQLRKDARAMHRQLLEEEMPFIPLWQLDPLMAYRKDRLILPPIDPLVGFTRVEEWEVRGSAR